MKKIAIIVLISSLLVGVFAACNDREADSSIPEHTSLGQIIESPVILHHHMSDDDERAFLYSSGQRHRALVEIRAEQAGALANHGRIVIHEKEVANLAQHYQRMGERDPYEAARNSLMRRQALYLEAISQGFDIASEEVYAVIQINKEATPDAVNFEDFLILLDGAQMTLDEYWMSLYDIIRTDLVIYHYTNHLRRQFFTVNESQLSTQDLHLMFDNMFEEKTALLIEKYR